MEILILEDEVLAAEHVAQMLQQYFGEVNLSFVSSIRQGKQWLKENDTPDLILSDIELLDGNVFALYEKVVIKCPIIFVTAYDKFLLKAFQTNGIAYLLKPFKYEQLVEALEKYQSLFSGRQKQGLEMDLILSLKNALESSKKEYKTRFAIKKSKGIFLLNVDDIVCFMADDDIVFAFDQFRNRHIVNFRMIELEETLNPSQFYRINRSSIVHIKFIEKMEAYFNNRLTIHLRHFDEILKTSGPKTADFRKWIEG